MHFAVRSAILAAITSALALPLTAQQGQPTLPGYDMRWTGSWTGTLSSNGLRSDALRLEITALERGATDVLYSLPNRLEYHRQFDVIRRSGDTLRCTSNADSINIVVVLDPSATFLIGTWTASGSPRTIRLQRTDGANVGMELSASEKAAPRTSMMIDYPAEKVMLAAELVRPDSDAGRRRSPLVVFISDHGEHDKDASHHGHTPYAVIARRLAMAGWASIRWDDRGVGGSTGTLLVAGVPELAREVDHVIRTVGVDPSIDTSRIVLIASGEGGMVAAAVASLRPVEHIVLLGMPMVDGLSIMRDAFDADEAESGTAEHVRATYRDMLTRWMTAIRLRPDPIGKRNAIAAIADSVYRAVNGDLTTYPRLQRLVDTNRRSYILGAIIPWLERYEGMNPAAAFRAYAAKLTLILAEEDPVVPARRNAEAFEAITGRPAIVIPRTNHYMQECQECTSQESDWLPNAVAEDVLKAVLRAVDARR